MDVELHDDNMDDNMEVLEVVEGNGYGQLIASSRGKLQSPSVMLSGHQAPVLSLSFSPCGEYLATADSDAQICIQYN